MSINKITLLGNLGRDPETRYLPDGAAVTTLALATTHRQKNKQSGQFEPVTSWHKVVFIGKKAEYLIEKCRKGSRLYVEGRVNYRNYEKDGQKHYVTEIVGAEFVPLDKSQVSGNSINHRDNYNSSNDFEEDSIPF